MNDFNLIFNYVFIFMLSVKTLIPNSGKWSSIFLNDNFILIPVFSKIIFYKSYIEKCLLLSSEYIFKPSYSKVNIFILLITK